MAPKAPALLITSLLAGPITAQSTVHPGTSLHLLPGTAMHLPEGLSLSVAPGASLVNDGQLRLAPTAALAEAAGSPVTGTGTEVIAMAVASPPVGLEPGGLGLTIGAAVALDSLTVTRGHTAMSDTGGATGIARWYRVLPKVNSGLAAAIGFRYDITELQGIAEADLALYAALPGDTIWQGVPSMVDLPQRTVFASWLDTLGTYTLFDGSLGTTVPAGDRTGGLRAGPNPATDMLELRDDGEGFRSLSVLDATGRTVLCEDLGHRTAHHRLTVASLAPGAYTLRTDDGRSLRFTRP